MALGFSSAISGLRAAQAAIQTVGQNIANQATPGYSRQSVLLTAANPVPQLGFLFGTGAKISGVTRSVDELLIGRIRTQESLLGQYSVQYNRLSELESYLNEPGENGIGALISKFFASVSSLSSSPEDSALRQSMVNSSKTLSQTFNSLSTKITQFRIDLGSEIENQVKAVNQITAEIATLNGQVLSLEGGTGSVANDVRDQRDVAVKKLAHLVGVSTVEDQSGSLRVQVGGYTVVAGTQSTPLETIRNSGSAPQITVKGSGTSILNPGGLIGGLSSSYSSNAEELLSAIDKLANSLILNVNRHHSTGVGKNGSYTELVSTHAPTDTNGNGNFGDELLNNAGLPFSIVNGSLYINVADASTGDIKTSKIDVDPTSTTLSMLAARLSDVDGISASVDSIGRLRISALSGYKFDFAPRLDQNPNTEKSFGSDSGTVSSTLKQPFALTNGDVLGVSIDGGPAVDVTFATADFANIGQATASEVAAKINTVLGGTYAKDVNGRVVIASQASGASSSVQLSNGTGNPATTMGLSTSLDAGDATSVSMTVSGNYTGASNDSFVFKPDGPGTIGVTAGLTIGVFNSSGGRIATLNVGDQYVPGDELAVANGVKVAFGSGSVSSAAGDFAQLEVVADSDTSDLLVGLGVNILFTGSKASDIGIQGDIEANASLIAASLSAEQGDNANLLRILGLQDMTLSDLGDKTLHDFYGGEIGKVGFAVSGSLQLVETQSFVTENLEIKRLQVSGVSVEEEMATLLQFQQMYQAISKYMSTLAELERTLIGSL